MGGSTRPRRRGEAARDRRPARAARAVAGFGSAKGSNEEAYLFQARRASNWFGVSMFNHCTRLCHASSVAALLEDVGSGAVSNQVAQRRERGSDLRDWREPHGESSGGRDLDQERREVGSEVDRGRSAPQRSVPARRLYNLQFNADTDVALLNAMLHVIVEEEPRHDQTFVRDRTSGYEAPTENVKVFA